MKKKAFLVFIICGALVVSVFLAFLFLAPRLIHSNFARDRTQAYVSAKTGGSLEYGKIGLSIFPRPVLTVEDATLKLPAKNSIHFESAAIALHLKPLLLGKVRIADLRLQAPSLRFAIPAALKENGSRSGRQGHDFIPSPASLAAVLSEESPAVIVNEGSITLHHGDADLFRFEDIQCRTTITSGGAEIHLESASNLWETFSFQGRLLPGASRLEGNVKVSRFKAGVVEKYFSPSKVWFALNDEGSVEGNVALFRGILEGRELHAEIGDKIVRNGRLKLDLLNEDGPFQLYLEAASDLAHLFPFLERILGKTPVTEEFDRIQKIEGRAEGRVVLNGTMRSFKTSVDVSRFHLRALYSPVPYPITIQSGQFHYDDASVAVKNLNGKMGKSFFSGLAGQLKWEPDLQLSISSGRMGIVLEEIYPWVVSYGALKQALSKVQTATGRLDLAALTLEGSFAHPESWKFQGEGAVKALRVTSPILPEPLLLEQGKFKADTVTLSLENAVLAMSDGRLRSNIRIDGYRNNGQSLQATFSGTVGPEMTEWILKQADISEKLRIKAPVAFADSQMDWKKGEEITLEVEAASSEGVNVSLGLRKTKERFDLHKLAISDGASSASFHFAAKEETLDVGFSGAVNKELLDKLLLNNSLLTGKIEGNFKAFIPLREPIKSTLYGSLHGWNLDLTPLAIPFGIHEIALKTEEQTIDMETMRFFWQERTGHSAGRMVFSEKDILVDLDLALNELDWKQIETLSNPFRRKESSRGRNGGLPPIQGNIRIGIDKFSYENLTWEPLHAKISLAGDSAEAAFFETRLCGVETPGKLKIAPESLWIDLDLLADNLPITPTARCVTREEIDGTFTLKGSISGHGKFGEIMKGMNGSLTFHARDGKINRSSLWTNIFNFLSISNLFTGGFVHFKKEGFQFSHVRANATLKGSVLHFEEGILYGDSMDVAFEGTHDIVTGKLDLTLVIAPFTTANWIIRHIPIVNYLMDGTIGTIPVKVTGDREHPKVTALPLSEVGSGLLGVLERTITAPFTAVKSVDDEIEKKAKQ